MSEEKPYVVYLPKQDVPQKLDRSTLSMWNEDIRKEVEGLYAKNREAASYMWSESFGHGRPPFIIQDGPPYANGDLHAGHLLNKTLKDVLLKQLLVSGKEVVVRFGWDCHGLPIENRAKKQMDSDEGVALVGQRDEYNSELAKRCANVASLYKERQKATLHKFGIYSTAPDYMTMDPDYVQREKNVFNTLKEKGFITKKNKPTWFSPSLRTTLANSEVLYKDVTDQSVYFYYSIGNGSRILVWTTTEWTVAGNQAICLNKNIEYCNVDGLVCSKKFADEQGWKSEPFDATGLQFYYDHSGDVKRVLFDDFVTDDHTGVVHLCGGHGDEDFEVLTKHGITPRNAADPDQLLEHMRTYKLGNVYVHKREDITHSVTVDWRTQERVVKVLTEQTYLDFDLFKVKNVLKQIKMSGKDRRRLEEMVFSRKDWCLSRQRVWGVPIDENNILDVWFDSGTAFMMNDVPADIYIEGVDQHRGWFQSSVILAAMMDRVPTKRIVAHGFVVDKDMERLSKSLGNGTPLEELYDQYGPDVLRLWVLLSDYTSDVVFSKDAMESASKQYFKLRNWMRYFVNNLYRDEHGYDSVSKTLEAEVFELKVNVERELLENVNPSKAFRAIVTFLGNYSSRLNEPLKDRFYESELDAPLREQLENEFHFLANHVGRMLFPFTPFLSMELAASMKNHR